MPSYSVNINTDAAVIFSNKLEKSTRSAFPVAVRQTLNKVAFMLKTQQMPKEFDAAFVIRSKNFEKRFSRVETAKGFNVRTMQARVGFTGKGQQAVDDLEQQERGGRIGSRSFVPVDPARVSGSSKKKIRTKHRLKNIRFKRIPPDKKKFMATVKQEGVGAFILYKDMLYEIKKINGNRIKLLPLYSFKEGRTVKVAGTKFMEKGSKKVARKMEQVYIDVAKMRLTKALK